MAFESDGKEGDEWPRRRIGEVRGGALKMARGLTLLFDVDKPHVNNSVPVIWMVVISDYVDSRLAPFFLARIDTLPLERGQDAQSFRFEGYDIDLFNRCHLNPYPRVLPFRS